MRLGMWVLHDHLVRALGADTLTPTCCRGSARPWWTSCRRTSPVRTWSPWRAPPGPLPADDHELGVNTVNLQRGHVTGAQETTLATLYGKAMDSREPDSILGDRKADKAVQRIDYDFDKLRMRRRDRNRPRCGRRLTTAG